MKTDAKVVCISAVQPTCQDCRLRKFCPASELNTEELAEFEKIARHRRPLARGEHLFHMQDKCDRLFTVRSGSLKTYTLTPDGREQITGFHLPGDTVGLDSAGFGAHASSAEALETTSVCELPLDRVPLLQNPGSIQPRLLALACQQVRRRDKHITLLGKESADQRLASFLVDLSQRFRTLGYSAEEFNLSMSRADIGNYLSLALETVSRLFARLRGMGLIEVERRRLCILESEGLQSLVDGDRHRQTEKMNCG